MEPQRKPWETPGGIAVIAVVVLINLVADWLWFKPSSLVLFVVAEAVVLGGIFWLVTWAVGRRLSG
jgi:hypothetical protein